MSDTSRILLIDDEEAFLLSLSRVLRIRGFTVCCVQDGESGIDRFREDPPFDGIVLDLRMPGLDGLEVLARLLALDSEIPVILLTGHADLDSGIRAIREGAFDVLLKPCDVEDLVVRLRVLRTAKAIRKRPVLWPRRVVREVTRFDYPRVGPGASFRDAVELLHHAASAYSPQEGPPSGASVPERISDLVVVAGEDGGFLGALSRRDLIRAASYAEPFPGDADEMFNWDDLVAHPDRFTGPDAAFLAGERKRFLSPSEPLAVAARDMIDEKRTVLPVVEKDRVLGVALLRDLLAHLEGGVDP